MLSDKMWKLLNEQVKWELESAYMYLGMAAYLNDKALPGFAFWMQKQAAEEVEHAMKIYNFIEERGNRVELLPIAAPAKEWANVHEIFEKSFEHEQFVTGLINNLVDAAAEEKDHASSVFLQWFVTEQVEEEDTFRGVLDKLSFLKPDSPGMLILDKEMATRTDD
ncbi:MAG: ferritin [Desulfovibrionaceae bacterium]|nr:ferritin [Desulfovibrionaceae bacterium]